MKFWIQSIILIIVATIIVGQVSLTPFMKSKYSVRFEIPLEETGDEDSNPSIESDKLFIEVIPTNHKEKLNKSLFGLFAEAHSGPIKEIIPPPPKA